MNLFFQVFPVRNVINSIKTHQHVYMKIFNFRVAAITLFLYTTLPLIIFLWQHAPSITSKTLLSTKWERYWAVFFPTNYTSCCAYILAWPWIMILLGILNSCRILIYEARHLTDPDLFSHLACQFNKTAFTFASSWRQGYSASQALIIFVLNNIVHFEVWDCSAREIGRRKRVRAY